MQPFISPGPGRIGYVGVAPEVALPGDGAVRLPRPPAERPELVRRLLPDLMDRDRGVESMPQHAGKPGPRT